MRVVFLCGSLEPGHDGIGDYVRRLAGELIRHGHQAAAIALHDMNLQQRVSETIQNDEIQEINTLRLSNQLAWKERIAKAYDFINVFNPEWISLQYVPFSFHSKGLPLGLSSRLKGLGKGRKWHIMFHELWTGIELNAPKKIIWWGYIQKAIIKDMLTKLQPKVIHTQSKIYHYLLLTQGYNTSLLPLFGNIPVKQVKNNVDKPNSENCLSFVIFGGIHENSLINEFACEASNYSRTKEIHFKFTFLGHNGRLKNEWATILTKEGFDVEVMGEQPVDVISKILSTSTFAITSTPLLLVDKSGTIASMIEHRTRVICIRNDWKVRYNLPKPENHVIEYQVGNLESILRNNKKPVPPINPLTKTTFTLINSFEKSETNA